MIEKVIQLILSALLESFVLPFIQDLYSKGKIKILEGRIVKSVEQMEKAKTKEERKDAFNNMP